MVVASAGEEKAGPDGRMALTGAFARASYTAAPLWPNHDDALPFRGGQAPRQTSYLEPGTAVSTGRRFFFIWMQQKGLEDVMSRVWSLRSI